MKIGIFHPKQEIPLIDNVMEHLIEGFMRKEPRAFVVREQRYERCDVAIRWGMHSLTYPQTTTYRKIIDAVHKGPMGIVELGWLGDRQQRFQFGFNGLSGAAMYFNSAGLDNRRKWEENYNFTLHEPRQYKKHDHILLLGQIPWDTSVQHIDYRKWLRETAEILLALDCPVIFRPHPKKPLAISEDELPKDIYFSRNNNLIDDLQGARSVVGYNSNAMVEAMIEGVPAIACHRGSMVYPITHHDPVQAKNPLFPKPEILKDQLIKITNCQWTVKEFYENTPWQLAISGLTQKFNLR